MQTLRLVLLTPDELQKLLRVSDTSFMAHALDEGWLDGLVRAALSL